MWLALIPVIVEALEAAPAVINSVRKMVDIIKADHPPSADEQAQIDAALEEAHRKLQQS